MKENDELIKSFLNRTFFKAWKNRYFESNLEKYANYSSLELTLNTSCNLKCKYCYYKNFGKQLYPPSISKPKLLLKNLDILFEWLTENQLYPNIDLFSGELFMQETGFKAVEKSINFYKENDIKGEITVPTNFTWILDDKKVDRIKSLLLESRKNNIKMHLSASIDGKLIENENRPFKNGTIRNDEFYDKIFTFASEWGAGFHPMVYSHNIEKWIDNFLWFQEMFSKYNINWTGLYLLEVRNKEWTKDQLKEYYKFCRFCIRYVYNRSGVKAEDFTDFIFKNKVFNIFSPFGKVGRGNGCSIQSAIQLRIGDLTHMVCHRASYKTHALWKFKTENDKIVDIEAFNPALFFSWASSDYINFPYCEGCFLKNFCLGQCWGSMFETNRSPFIPIPTVCALEHTKVKAIFDELRELDLDKQFALRYKGMPEKFNTIKMYYETFYKGEDNGI